MYTILALIRSKVFRKFSMSVGDFVKSEPFILPMVSFGASVGIGCSLETMKVPELLRTVPWVRAIGAGSVAVLLCLGTAIYAWQLWRSFKDARLRAVFVCFCALAAVSYVPSIGEASGLAAVFANKYPAPSITRISNSEPKNDEQVLFIGSDDKQIAVLRRNAQLGRVLYIPRTDIRSVVRLHTSEIADFLSTIPKLPSH